MKVSIFASTTPSKETKSHNLNLPPLSAAKLPSLTIFQWLSCNSYSNALQYLQCLQIGELSVPTVPVIGEVSGGDADA